MELASQKIFLGVLFALVTEQLDVLAQPPPSTVQFGIFTSAIEELPNFGTSCFDLKTSLSLTACVRECNLLFPRCAFAAYNRHIPMCYLCSQAIFPGKDVTTLTHWKKTVTSRCEGVTCPPSGSCTLAPSPLDASLKQATCSKGSVCEALPTVENAYPNWPNVRNVGTKARYTCKTLSPRVPGSNPYTTCGENLEWSAIPSQTCMPARSSCANLQMTQPTLPSGLYVISSGDTVYCQFNTPESGYTFLKKESFSADTDINRLFNSQEAAAIRILYEDGSQTEVIVSQLTTEKDTPLSFQANEASGYQEPVDTNLGLYLYLGFLPREKASISRSTQGYNAAGQDFTFTNCDGNPNSYIALYNIPSVTHVNPSCGGSNGLMTGWITKAIQVSPQNYLQHAFFWQYEMHMGGCGGLVRVGCALQQNSVQGIALGLPHVKQTN